MHVNAVDGGVIFGAWNPGIHSQVPRELLSLATIFRAEHVFTNVAAALELQGITGLPLHDLVSFRPERLTLHELAICSSSAISAGPQSRSRRATTAAKAASIASTSSRRAFV